MINTEQREDIAKSFGMENESIADKEYFMCEMLGLTD